MPSQDELVKPLTEAELDEPYRFADLMRIKLERNVHKGTWRTCSLDYLRMRLLEEISELLMAVKMKETQETVAFEAADVANLAMMIADVYARTEGG